jgi:dihydrofolate reductase
MANNNDRIPPVSIILAQDAENGVGYKGKLPWEGQPYKNDMKMFRELTIGKPESINAVVMGYATWESIPLRFRPLKSRVNIVLTENHYEAMVTEGQADFVFRSWDDLKEHLTDSVYDRLWVIGGVNVYEGAFRNLLIRNVYRTVFNKKFQCDKYVDVDRLLVHYGFSFTTIVIRDDDDGRVDLITITGQKADCQ